MKLARPNDPRLVEVVLEGYDAYIMSVFWQLHRDRPETYAGVGGLTLQSMVHYQTLFADVLNTDDIYVLQTVDRFYLNTTAELQKGMT